MRYDVVLSDKASTRLQELPVDVAICVDNHLEQLAADPFGLGRPAAFPYRPVGQIYQFWCEGPDGEQFYVTVFFHFQPGETSIRVFSIGASEYGPAPDAE